MVTGASSGLGAEFARQLAPACDAMILVARRGELLENLATELGVSSPETEVHCLTADLTQAEECAGLMTRCQSMSLMPDLLVNNAGMGDYGSFEGAEWSKLDAMLQVNVTALTHLSHGFLPAMIASGRGAIINVSSLASTLPIPDFAVYAATKAYVSSFSEALRLELREHQIPVLAVCPGPVHTNFGKVAMRDVQRASLPSRDGFYVEAEQVVRDSIHALHTDRARVYPGWKVALLAAGISLLPMVLLRPLVVSRRGKL
ncbi:SDR family oxidoreductase [Verrucomicrobiaceae bacterium 5K15]|uniref:SDR family oxidoreductase n=1 Tax=Oceaniferula flava TaxID=2800421 RepID=A0AAE2SCA5_9BACT|nr:SDR family oxidoreductase [Oceaniferula flavus]MBM1137120.1 SDR family oxidoreductase [Oceaniferula flavus]